MTILDWFYVKWTKLSYRIINFFNFIELFYIENQILDQSFQKGKIYKGKTKGIKEDKDGIEMEN
jgi:hypothetical protein